MNILIEQGRPAIHVDNRTHARSGNSLRIAFCLPERAWLDKLASGESPDAAFIQQGYIATGLQDRGHNLTYLAPHNLNHMVYMDQQGKLQIAAQTWSASRWFDLASKISWQVQQRLGIPYLNVFSNYRRYDACLQCLPGYDLVHERNGLYNVGVAMACQRLKLPYVMFFDADQIAEHDFMGKPITGLLRWRAQKLLRYNLSVASGVICVSEPAKTQLITTWNVPPEKIVVFPNGVDVQRFRPDPEARAEVRTSLKVDNNPLIIFVGNFYEWHDVATLLDAFAQLLVTCPQARLVLVGDGPQRSAMMQRVAELDITHATQFTGLVTHAEVPRLMSAADVAVAPVPAMKRDLWLSPMKLFEYMAVGTAVIATSVGQLAEVIKHDKNGFLVPPGDAPALAAEMAKLIDNPALRAQLSWQAREDAVEKYSWAHYVSRLERLYAAVIAGQSFNLI